MIGKFNSETQTDNGNIWTLTYIFDSSLVPCISRGILKRYPPPPRKKYIYCVVPENIHAHPKEGYQKFQGGGGGRGALLRIHHEIQGTSVFIISLGLAVKLQSMVIYLLFIQNTNWNLHWYSSLNPLALFNNCLFPQAIIWTSSVTQVGVGVGVLHKVLYSPPFVHICTILKEKAPLL